MSSAPMRISLVVAALAVGLAVRPAHADNPASSNAVPHWARTQAEQAEALQQREAMRRALISGGQSEQPSGLRQIKLPEHPLHPPPEAWRNMDTHSPVDPRILEHRMRAEEAAKRQKVLDDAKAKHRASLWEGVRKSRQYNPSDPGVAMAVEDAAHYFALRQTESEDQAKAWLSARLSSLQEGYENLENRTHPVAVAHDTVIAVAALGAGASGSGNMSQQTQQMMNAMASHIRALRSMTGAGYEPPRITAP